MVYTYLVIIIILIIFILFNYYLNIQENFDTYFIPFYNNGSNLLRDFYKNEDYNKNFFKHKINYNDIYIYSSSNGYIFFNDFNKKLIQKSRIAKSNLVKLDNYNDNINYLLKNNNSITNITLPIYLKNPNNNLKLISNLHNIYLICLTKLKYKFYNLNNIPFNSKIGILNEKNTIFYYYKKLFKDLNIDINDNNIKIYKNTEELYNGLMNDEVKLILYFTELPNKKLDDFINIDFMNELIILPFDLNNKISNLFFKKNDYAKIKYFDLNKITQKYMTKKFGNYYYFTYKPDIKLLTIKEFLICNKNINNNLVNDIFKFTFNYKQKFDKTPFQIDNIEPSYDLIKYIPYHPEVLNGFRNFGYITNIKSPNCKYFVGKKECTQELLDNYGLD